MRYEPHPLQPNLVLGIEDTGGVRVVVGFIKEKPLRFHKVYAVTGEAGAVAKARALWGLPELTKPPKRNRLHGAPIEL